MPRIAASRRVPARPGRAVSALAALLLALVFALPLAGCGGLPPRPADLPERVELAAVPFHPQQAYQCGPAALAMLLNASGVAVTPDALVPQVYLPGRQGSLQAELVAATRRHGRVPYVLPPDPGALRTELAAGRPVLVLQNFGTRGSPQWHYAVAVGYEPGRVLLRSGLVERQRLHESRFVGTWARGDYWALLALRPDELPATAEPVRWLAAASGLESTGQPALAARAYETAASRWPAEGAAWLGLGNARHALGDARAAELAWARAASGTGAAAAAAANNRAVLLAQRGCGPAARTQWERARAAAVNTPFAAAVEASRVEIESAPAGGADCPAP